MRINPNVLVVDVSDWCFRTNAKELEDNGVTSVIVGLYHVTQNGKRVLSPKSREHCINVATKSKMVLQAYCWDDITEDPAMQANWLWDTMVKEGLPIKWIWADQEMWWTSWTAYWNAIKTGDYSQVPVGEPAKISWHNQKFMETFFAHSPASGVYTNNGFVSSWAPLMDGWLGWYNSWIPQYGRQPALKTSMTWDQLRMSWMPSYDIRLSRGQVPNKVVGHQFTGDRCLLPGTYDWYGRKMPCDVSTFFPNFVTAISNNVLPTPPITPPSPPQPAYKDYIVLPAAIYVRKGPAQTFAIVRNAVKNEVLHVIGNATNGYVQMTDGNWVWAAYLALQA
jgi:hypothetical protein